MTGAAHHRGASRQDFRTPDDFRAAVTSRFGEPQIDFACSRENMFGRFGATEAGVISAEGLPLVSRVHDGEDWARNSLAIEWSYLIGGPDLGWLNPPFADIAPWAERCARVGAMRKELLFLVPASVGSNWFQEHVHHKAMVLALNPRMSFDGKSPYPKDLMLCLFGFGYSGFDVWRWK